MPHNRRQITIDLNPPDKLMARCGSQYFFLRLSQKDQFMSARAASASTSPTNPPKPRTPARIADTRYEIKRELRKVRCDHCHELESGNAAGAFWHRQNTPTAGEREAAWERECQANGLGLKLKVVDFQGSSLHLTTESKCACGNVRSMCGRRVAGISTSELMSTGCLINSDCF